MSGIFTKKEIRPLKRKIDTTRDFLIKNLKIARQKRIFSNGNFTWTVKGVRRIDSDKDGKLDKIFQEGAESESSFNTNIPTPTKSKAKGAVNPYGL